MFFVCFVFLDGYSEVRVKCFADIWTDIMNNLSLFQEFRWTYINELRQDPEECLDARYTDKENIYREKCHELGGNQKFTYKKVSMS